MPRFEPFAGLRYDLATLAEHGATLDDVVAPPYDVIDPPGRAALVRRCALNAVRIELPEPEEGLDRYQSAAALLGRWRDDGVLQLDSQAAFYQYTMSYMDSSGNLRRTAGVLGALEVSRAENGEVLPHEMTMPKPKGDRLDLLRACRANTSPVWGLSLSAGLSSCLAPGGGTGSQVVALDEDGVTHECSAITDPAVIARIAAIVGASPVLLADGHHRYETALTYREERRAANGGAQGDYDLVLALVVELTEDQLTIGPIHRMLTGLPDGYDLVGALGRGFHLEQVGGALGPAPVGSALGPAPVVLTRQGAWSMRARPELVASAAFDLDSSRLELALRDIADHELSYHHDPTEVVRAVREGRASAGVLIRPATAAVIEAAARAGRRLPAKTTFFTPKPRTGMVFRLLRW
jgi:uncharacterized protein (DUF1015 family)